MLRRINPILPELVIGILFYGIVLQLTGVWFMEDRLGYSIGLWIGIALAIGMAVNMAIVILDAADVMASGGNTARTALWSVLRYVVVIGAFAAVGYFELGNLIVMFFGVMGLKVSAYLQPMTHKWMEAIREKCSHNSR